MRFIERGNPYTRLISAASAASAALALGALLGLAALPAAAQVTVIDMIPVTRSGELDRDAEPNLAVDPANPQNMVASAFTSDPGGGPGGVFFLSTDGGAHWTIS